MKKTAALSVVGAVVLLLVGCTDDAEPAPSPSATTSVVASQEPSPTSSSASATAEPASPSPSEQGSVEWTSVGGRYTVSTPGNWDIDADAMTRRSQAAGVVEVIGVWTVPSAAGDVAVTLEADAQGTPAFDAASYRAAYFDNVDAGLGQSVEPKSFVAADGSVGLWVTAYANTSDTRPNEVAFFIFASDRIIAGHVSSSTALPDEVVTAVEQLSTSIVP